MEFPDSDEETEIMNQLYDDVNDLYTDEHLIMTQADLLEQMYNILHEINMAARHERKLVYTKRQKDVEDNAILDPDMFPINRLSEDLVVEYESVWET